MLLTEILSTPVPWKWTFTDREHAEAKFVVGDVPYTMIFNYGERGWSMSLANDKTRKRVMGFDKGSPEAGATYGVTGSGSASVVMATATEIVRAFREKHPGAPITFSAVEPSRQKLYARMLQRAGVEHTQFDAGKGAKFYQIK